MIKREIIFNKFGGRCAYCGCEIKLKGFHVDHLISLCEYRNKIQYYVNQNFNPHKIENLMPSCASCNNYKRAHSLSYFRSEIENQVIRQRKRNPMFRLAERFCQISCHPKPVVFFFESFNSSQIG